jgi:integrase
LTESVETYRIDHMRMYRRENGIYYVELNRTTRKSLKTNNIAKARKLFAAMKEEILQGKLVALKGNEGPTLKDFKAEYKKWSEQIKKAPDSIRSDELALRTLIDHIGNKKLGAITLKNLDEFTGKVLRSKRSTETVNTYIRRIRAALNKAVEWNYLGQNPYDKKPRGKILVKGVKKLPRFLEPEEFPKVMEAIKDDAFRAMIQLYILTGCRRAELVSLKWPEVKEGYIIILATKNKEQRIVPLSEEAHKALAVLKRTKAGYVFPKWRTRDAVTRKFHNCIVDAKIPHIRLHDLRHTAASYLAMSGVTLETIGDILGQKDKRATEIYRHLLPGYVQAQMEMLGNVATHFSATKTRTGQNLTLVTHDNNKKN